MHWISLDNSVNLPRPHVRFVVREFVYDEAELEAGKTELNKLANDKKRQYVSYYL